METGQNVPSTNTNYTEYLPQPELRSIFLEPVSSSDVLNAARKLKSKSSYGHDGISSNLLKESINNIINPITNIINKSFECGVVPDEMKIAKVIPIYKSSDRNSITNYRPLVF